MTKLFLNMVIHDFRNPTTSIKVGLEQTILKIRQIMIVIKKHQKFSKNAVIIQSTLTKKQIQFEDFAITDCKSVLPEVENGDHLNMRN